MTPLRLVFLGSDPIALPLLHALVRRPECDVQLVGVFTQPDRPVGRGQKVTANEIKEWAIAQALPVFQPEKLTEEIRVALAELKADLALVMAYGHILRDDFIATPRLGTVNLHASILPKYRGASPIQSAVAMGEVETGVSLMRIVRRLDAGPVADIEPVGIESLDTALEIETKLAAACLPLLNRTLEKIRSATLEFVPQDEGAATFCRRLVKDDGVLDFTISAASLASRINGLFPWPACRVDIDGQLIKIGLADVPEPLAASGKPPGSVIGTDPIGLLIQTGSGVVRFRRLQRPGGKMLEATEFLRGFSIPAETVLTSHPMPGLVSSAPFRKH